MPFAIKLTKDPWIIDQPIEEIQTIRRLLLPYLHSFQHLGEVRKQTRAPEFEFLACEMS